MKNLLAFIITISMMAIDNFNAHGQTYYSAADNIVGTWQGVNNNNGQYFYTRFDNIGNYQMWEANSPSCSCGTYRAENGWVYMHNINGNETGSPIAFQGKNKLIFTG